MPRLRGATVPRCQPTAGCQPAGEGERGSPGRRRRRIATCGVHAATVAAAAWPRLGRDLARIGRPGQVIAPLDAKSLRRPWESYQRCRGATGSGGA